MGTEPEPGLAPGRVVALGASNLTRGWHTVVSTARAAWGTEVEVLGALGHGRSYGVPSRAFGRTLPGILESGLWHTLSSLPPAETRGLVTDVGNDILYGFSASQTLAWVEQAVDRLQQVTSDVVLAGLPLASIRRLSRPKFLLFRSVLFPWSRLSLAEVVDAAEQVGEGILSLSKARDLRLVNLRADWYGADPIHIRPDFWRSAWQEILGAAAQPESPALAWREGLQLYLMRADRQQLFGIEVGCRQPGTPLRRGGKVWLF
jgi:hypothetical protein